jgi:hypothetical protein
MRSAPAILTLIKAAEAKGMVTRAAYKEYIELTDEPEQDLKVHKRAKEIDRLKKAYRLKRAEICERMNITPREYQRGCKYINEHPELFSQPPRVEPLEPTTPVT